MIYWTDFLHVCTLIMFNIYTLIIRLTTSWHLILRLNWLREVALFASVMEDYSRDYSTAMMHYKLRFKKLVFGFGSARSVSWFRTLWPLISYLSLARLSLKHSKQFSLRILYIRILFNLARLTCRSHPKPSKRSLDLLLSSYLAPIRINPLQIL